MFYIVVVRSLYSTAYLILTPLYYHTAKREKWTETAGRLRVQTVCGFPDLRSKSLKVSE